MKQGARLGLLSLSLIALIGAFWLWASSPYPQPEAVQVAKDFLTKLQTGQLQTAFEMTNQSAEVGTRFSDFQALAARESCYDGSFLSANPPQTNGNRLRRRLQGQAVNPQRLSLDFQSNSGPCRMFVHLKSGDDGRWRVSGFGAHAY